MILTLAVIVWLVLGLAVAVFVGAGAHSPRQPERPVRRQILRTTSGRIDVGPRTGVPRLYVVDRSHPAPSSSRRQLLLPRHGRS